MWTEPKVDWKATDYYNVEDWYRIRANLEYLYEWLQSMRAEWSILRDTDEGRGLTELPYVQYVNNMEENLADLQRSLGLSFTEEYDQKTWYSRLDMSYKSNPTYQDWNRWEAILARVHLAIRYVDNYLHQPISGAAYCGSDRTTIRFSRGRELI